MEGRCCIAAGVRQREASRVSCSFVVCCRACPIKSVADFGVFVKVAPGVKALVHRSQLDLDDFEEVADIYQVGDRIDVKVLQPYDDRLTVSQIAAMEAAAV